MTKPDLPKIAIPTYDFTVTSNKETIKVKPFSVSEEKLLLMAAEGGNNLEIVESVKQVIKNCVIGGNFDVEKLPFFDIDNLFIFLRAKSIGESIDVNLTCNNTLDNGLRCGHTFPTKLDLSKNEVVENDTVSPDIKLDKTSGVMMKYPTYGVMKQLEGTEEIEKSTKIILNSIEYIYDKKGTYSAKDYSSKELQTFIEGLTQENYDKLESFVHNFPTFVVILEATCPKCGYHHIVRYSDFRDFFY